MDHEMVYVLPRFKPGASTKWCPALREVDYFFGIREDGPVCWDSNEYCHKASDLVSAVHGSAVWAVVRLQRLFRRRQLMRQLVRRYIYVGDRY